MVRRTLWIGKIGSPKILNNMKNKYNLPINYYSLSPKKRREVREQYILEQNGLCYYCGEKLDKLSPHIFKPINVNLFPQGFFDHPIHLQHNHDTGMTEGAVHAVCNAVMWQYEGR
jgi:hypothetical protein